MAGRHGSKPQMHGQEQGAEQTHLPSEQNTEKINWTRSETMYSSSPSPDALSHKISPIVPPTEDQVPPPEDQVFKSLSLSLSGGWGAFLIISYLNHDTALTHTTAMEVWPHSTEKHMFKKRKAYCKSEEHWKILCAKSMQTSIRLCTL